MEAGLALGVGGNEPAVNIAMQQSSLPPAARIALAAATGSNINQPIQSSAVRGRGNGRVTFLPPRIRGRERYVMLASVS